MFVTVSGATTIQTPVATRPRAATFTSLSRMGQQRTIFTGVLTAGGGWWWRRISMPRNLWKVTLTLLADVEIDVDAEVVKQ